jgi:anaerobic C4-dicarboxylate transporter
MATTSCTLFHCTIIIIILIRRLPLHNRCISSKPIMASETALETIITTAATATIMPTSSTVAVAVTESLLD